MIGFALFCRHYRLFSTSDAGLPNLLPATSLSTNALMFTSGPAYGEAVGTYEGEPLYHASLDGAEYRTLLDESGFEVVEHIVEDPDCGGHTVWLAQLG